MSVTLNDKLKQLPKAQQDKIQKRANELITKAKENKNFPPTVIKKTKPTGK